MKNTFAAATLLAAGMFASSGVAAKDLTGWFANGAAGRVNYHASYGADDLGSDHGTAVIVNAGYRTQFIGFEAGYTDLGSISAHDAGDAAKLSGDGWTAGINAHLNPTRQWYISARSGAFVWKLHAKATYAGADYAADRQSLGWYAGVGTGFDINRHWSVGANFDYYKISKHDLDIGNRIFTIGAEYRF